MELKTGVNTLPNSQNNLNTATPTPQHRRPALAVLDEVTSAVSEQAAAQLYGQLHSEAITCLRCDWLADLRPVSGATTEAHACTAIVTECWFGFDP